MATTTKIDWNTAQRDYLSDPTMSYAKIAFKYGVSETAVKDWAERGQWQQKRQETSLKISEKLPEKIAESVAQYQARKFMHGKQVADRAMQVLLDERTKIGGKTANEMLSTAYKLQTEAMGLDDKDKPPGDTNNFFFGSLTDFVTAIQQRKAQRQPAIEGETLPDNNGGDTTDLTG